eukprot:Rhum_TRINITY_DN9719_c0_g1::Rhum_TRINITY_DN9719_c0_g1_i1::g.34905::m.34905
MLSLARASAQHIANVHLAHGARRLLLEPLIDARRVIRILTRQPPLHLADLDLLHANRALVGRVGLLGHLHARQQVPQLPRQTHDDAADAFLQCQQVLIRHVVHVHLVVHACAAAGDPVAPAASPHGRVSAAAERNPGVRPVSNVEICSKICTGERRERACTWCRTPRVPVPAATPARHVWLRRFLSPPLPLLLLLLPPKGKGCSGGFRVASQGVRMRGLCGWAAAVSAVEEDGQRICVSAVAGMAGLAAAAAAAATISPVQVQAQAETRRRRVPQPHALPPLQLRVSRARRRRLAHAACERRRQHLFLRLVRYTVVVVVVGRTGPVCVCVVGRRRKSGTASVRGARLPPPRSVRVRVPFPRRRVEHLFFHQPASEAGVGVDVVLRLRRRTRRRLRMQLLAIRPEVPPGHALVWREAGGGWNGGWGRRTYPHLTLSLFSCGCFCPEKVPAFSLHTTPTSPPTHLPAWGRPRFQ